MGEIARARELRCSEKKPGWRLSDLPVTCSGAGGVQGRGVAELALCAHPLPPRSAAAASAVWKLYWCQAQSVLMNPEIWEAELVQRQKSIFQPVVTAPTSTPACSLSLSLSSSGQRSECVNVCVWGGGTARVLVTFASRARKGCRMPVRAFPTRVVPVPAEPGLLLCKRRGCCRVSWLRLGASLLHRTHYCEMELIIKYFRSGEVPSGF